MHNYPDYLIKKIMEQLEADGHYELVNEILATECFTSAESEPKNSSWVYKGYSDAEIRAMQGVEG